MNCSCRRVLLRALVIARSSTFRLLGRLPALVWPFGPAGSPSLALRIAIVLSTLVPLPVTAGTLIEDLEAELGRQVDRVSRSLVTVVAHLDTGTESAVQGGPFGIFSRPGERQATGCGVVI